MAENNNGSYMIGNTPPHETPCRLDELTSNVSPSKHPSNGTAKQYNSSHGDQLEYIFLFKKIAQNQTTTGCPPLPAYLLRKFRSLPLHEQIANFGLSQQLTEDELRSRWAIANDILSLLRKQPEFKGYTAAVFGSLLSGSIANESNIIKISIDLESDNKNMESVPEAGHQMSISDLRSHLANTLRNVSCSSDPAQVYMEVYLTKGRWPFIHLRTAQPEIIIELHFNNRKSVRNSKLIQLYLNLEPISKRLLIFVQYWTNYYAVRGTERFTKDVQPMLVLVFLMEKGILPSVLFLQAVTSLQHMEQGTDGNLDLFGEWDCSYCDDVDVIRKYFRPVSLNIPSNSTSNEPKIFFDLLTAFFERMMDTNFSHNLMSPLLGKILPEQDLEKTLVECINTLPFADVDSWKKWHEFYLTSMSFAALSDADIRDPFARRFSPNDLRMHRKRLQFANQTLSVLRRNPSSFLELFECSIETYSERPVVTAPLPVGAEHAAVLPTNIPSENQESFQVENGSVRKRETAYEILEVVCNRSLAWNRSFKNDDPFYAVKFNMSYPFLETYLSVLCRCRMLAAPNGNNDFTIFEPKWQMISLWSDFAMEFRNTIFNSGLMLIQKKVSHEVVDCAINEVDKWPDNKAYTKNLILNMMKNGLERTTNQEHAQAIRTKIKGLIKLASAVYYDVTTYNVTYPFWEERPKLKYKPVLCPLEEEKMISLEIMKSLEKSNAQRAGTSANMTTTFTPFCLKVLVKLDTRVDQTQEVCGIPTISFVVQECWDEVLPAQVRRSQNHIRAMKCIVDTLKRTFEVFQSRKLSEWLEIEKL